MRKVLIITFMFLLLSILIPIGYATEYSDPNDARNIPPEVQQLAEEANADVVYHKLYTDTLVMLCSECGTMEEVLAQMQSSGYMAATADKHWSYKMENGKPVSTSPYHYYTASLPKQLIAEEAIRAIAPDICIENVYFLTTGFVGNAEPSAIYYKTNLGDYIYYDINFDAHVNDGIILNANRFLEYMHQWRAYIVKQTGGFIGGYPNMDIDLSAYDWRSPDFDPDAPLPGTSDVTAYLVLGGSVIVLAGIVVVGVVVTRKRKKEEELEIPEDE